MAGDLTQSISGFLDIMLDGDKYVDRLDAKTKKKAKEELNEDPKEVDNSVKQFRAWVQQQPHLNVCTDKTYLLAFLRRCKYSQLEARSMFDVYHSAISKHLRPWMIDIKVDTEDVKKVIATRCILLLPGRDDEGRRIIVWRPGCFSTASKQGYEPDSFFRVWGFLLMITQREPMTQVNGYVIVQDGTNATMKHNTYFGLERFKNIFKIFFNNFPLRAKKAIYYNMGTVFEAMMLVVKPVLSKKITDRFSVHNSLETVYKEIPMRLLPREYLPDDYRGPCAGTVDEISNNFYAKICEKPMKERIWQISHNQFKVDETKRPATKEPSAAFRKLNIE